MEEVYDAIAVDLALVMIEGKHDPMTPTYFRKMNALNSVAKINHARTLNKNNRFTLLLAKVSPRKVVPRTKDAYQLMIPTVKQLSSIINIALPPEAKADRRFSELSHEKEVKKVNSTGCTHAS